MTTPAAENAYLVGLRLAGRKVVVVGGGTVAQRRVPVLIAHGADGHVIARAATPAVEALAAVLVALAAFALSFCVGVIVGAILAATATLPLCVQLIHRQAPCSRDRRVHCRV